MTQQPDSPTSQFTAVRWTFYRRLGLLLRTQLQDDGTTYSLHDIADRTGGRVSADELIGLLAQGAQARPDIITCILLAHAFDIDPQYFVSDAAVESYMRELHCSAGGSSNTADTHGDVASTSVTSYRVPAIAH